MGKEAKIGLAVILVLLITFGVVLVQRLSSSDDATAAGAAGEKSKSTPRGNEKTPARDTKPGSSVPRPNGPMVLSPATLASKAPKQPPDGTLQFPPNKAAGSPGSGVSQSAQRPYLMPELRDVSANPNPPYGSNVQSAPQPGQVGGAGTPGSAIAGNLPPANPSGYPPVTPAAPPLPGQQFNALRVLSPPRAAPGTAPPVSNPYQGTTGYAAAGSSTVPSPRAGLTPPYRTPAAPPVVARPAMTSDPRQEFDSNYGNNTFRSSNGEYEVQPNDSFWVISEKLYGTGAYFKALAEHNRNRVDRDDRLAVGDVISAPGVAELEEAFPELCPKASRRETIRNRAMAVSMRGLPGAGNTYTVEEGDTLSDIARYELGKSSRWPEIHALNRDVLGDDYDYLVPGTELILPGGSRPADSVTVRPGNGSIHYR